MGKGDRKTRRGKLFMGTYGARRPKPGKIAKRKRQAAETGKK